MLSTKGIQAVLFVLSILCIINGDFSQSKIIFNLTRGILAANVLRHNVLRSF
jgi:hypothetical protein